MNLADFVCALAENQEDLNVFNSGTPAEREALMNRYGLSEADQDTVNEHIEEETPEDFLEEYDENNCWTEEAMFVC